MGVNWKALGTVGLGALNVVGKVVPAVGMAEAITTALIARSPETATQKLGPLKKEVVMQAVLVSLGVTEMMTGKDLGDNERMAQGISKIIDGVVDVMHAMPNEAQP